MLFIYLTFSLHFKSLLLNSTTFLAYSVTNSKKCKHTQYKGPYIFKGNNYKTESRCHCNHFTIRHDLYRVEDFIYIYIVQMSYLFFFLEISRKEIPRRRSMISILVHLLLKLKGFIFVKVVVYSNCDAINCKF